MSTLLWIGGGLSVSLLAYLMFALLYPEKLS
jgi:K+-transporting ATPase KdpF subunit